MTLVRNVSFLLFATLSVAACTSKKDRGYEDGSSVLDLEQFDPSSFNAGDTFEYMVNPTYTRDGEQSNEVVDPLHAAWLASVDGYAGAVEELNFVALQQGMKPAEVAAHNAELKLRLGREAASSEGFTLEEAEQIYAKMVALPQITDHGHYDPEFSIGFCFGRAMIVHGLARNAFVTVDGQAVSRKNVPVRKIWVTGPMGQWKHHVATMVVAKEADVGFWVIDNFVGSVVPASAWMDYLTAMYPRANVLFNVSRANRFSEANSLRYYQVLLDDPFFNDFFRDFLLTHVPAINANKGIDITPPAVTPEPADDEVLESIAASDATFFGGATPAPLNEP